MASSNRHWPSMFKSKPCNTSHHQWQHDINPSLMSSTSHKPQYSSVGGCEERSPEPKPRWNPKPEQIRILEAIFNSGMVNPPRDEIRKIRAQLQEYGQVGDANVFYWFQNRKSRSKHKQRQLQAVKTQPQQAPPLTSASAAAATPPSPLSSSIPTVSADKPFSMASPHVIDVWNPRTSSVSQTFFQTTHGDFSSEPFFPVQQTTGETAPSSVFTQAFCSPLLPNATHLPDQTVGIYSGLLLNNLVMSHGPSTKKTDHDKLKLQDHLGSPVTTASPATHTIVPPTNTLSVSSTINHVQGGAGAGELGAVGPANPAKSTVFINDVAFEVGARPLNVREVFGEDAVLFHSSGQPVLVNEWGLTLQPLQHGAFYYLVRTFDSMITTQ